MNIFFHLKAQEWSRRQDMRKVSVVKKTSKASASSKKSSTVSKKDSTANKQSASDDGSQLDDRTPDEGSGGGTGSGDTPVGTIIEESELSPSQQSAPSLKGSDKSGKNSIPFSHLVFL